LCVSVCCRGGLLYIVMIALFGAAGVLTRYGLTIVLPAGFIPWAVLASNVVGGFFAGYIFALKILPNESASNTIYHAILIGLLGGLTTFSSLSLDTVRLMSEARFSFAMLNIFLNNLLSLGACFLGLRIASIS
jgi:fluoride exporter